MTFHSVGNELIFFQKGSNHQPVNILNIFDILNMYIMYVYIYIYTFSGFEMMFMYDHNTLLKLNMKCKLRKPLADWILKRIWIWTNKHVFLGGRGNTAGHTSHQPWESPKFDGCQEQVILLQQTLGEDMRCWETVDFRIVPIYTCFYVPIKL